MKIDILHGAISADAGPDEQDTLIQVREIGQTLRAQGHQVRELPLGLDLGDAEARLRAGKPDLVFNLTESVAGASRLIYLAPAILDHLGLRYTGSSTEAMFITTSKLLTKAFLEMNDLPLPGWVRPGDARVLPSGRLIVKSVWEHASVGLDEESIVEPRDRAELEGVFESRKGLLGGECFAESFIDGREFNLSVLDCPDGPRVLPPAEMRFENFAAGKPRMVGYQAKWDESSFEYRNTNRTFDFQESDRDLVDELSRLARETFLLFGLRGYARVDFRVDMQGRPFILETNANPCLSPGSGFPAAAARAGMTYDRMIADIVSAAMRYRK